MLPTQGSALLIAVAFAAELAVLLSLYRIVLDDESGQRRLSGSLFPLGGNDTVQMMILIVFAVTLVSIATTFVFAKELIDPNINEPQISPIVAQNKPIDP